MKASRGSNVASQPVSKSPSGNTSGYRESGSRKFSEGTRYSSRGGKGTWQADAQKDPDPILFQTYFKSVGPRTYAAQLKRARNGNQYLVFTEGRRDKITDEVRKTSLYVYSEDFKSFFMLLKETAEYVRGHPLPADVAEKRVRYWKKQKRNEKGEAKAVAGSRH